MKRFVHTCAVERLDRMLFDRVLYIVLVNEVDALELVRVIVVGFVLNVIVALCPFVVVVIVDLDVFIVFAVIVVNLIFIAVVAVVVVVVVNALFIVHYLHESSRFQRYCLFGWTSG